MEGENINITGNNENSSFGSCLPSTSKTVFNDDFAGISIEKINLSGSSKNDDGDKYDSNSSLSSEENCFDGNSGKDDILEYMQLGGYNEGISTWNNQQESDSISQFLNGELTFSEYTSRMDDDDDDLLTNVVFQSSGDQSIPVFIDKLDKSEEKRPDSSKKSKKKKYVRRNLPPTLKGLMGEANLRYARGDKDTAIKICLEIIRQVPTAPEPYQTLAGLYEELGHRDKSIQMSLIAAHLSPSDSNQWIHLAEVSYVTGNFKQAITCYTKAIRADEKNIELHFKRAELLEKEGQKNVALKGFSRLLTILDPVEDGDKILELSKLVAEMYHKDRDLEKTRQTLEIAFNKCPALVTSGHINLLLEVLLCLKDYSSCLEVLIRFCDVSVEIEPTENDVLVVEACKVPGLMAIDIKVKLITLLIHLKSLKPLDELLLSLEAESVDEVGDLYLDIAEAFISEDYFSNAIPLLESLISSQSFNLPAVWLQYADCLKKLNRVEESIKAYFCVIEQAPRHNDARLVVAKLLTKLGRTDQAISVLMQDEKCEVIDPDLLYERCMLLKDKPEHFDSFLTEGQLFLLRHCIQIRRVEELKTLGNYRTSSYYKKRNAIIELRQVLGENYNVPQFSEGRRSFSVAEEWDLFMNMCHLCYKLKKFPLLQRLALSAQGSHIFTENYSKEIDILCLMSSFYNNDSYLAYNYARHLVLKDITLPRPWNIFNLVLMRGEDTRRNKFVMRLLSRNQSHAGLSLLHANNCLVSGTYKYALNEYIAGYRKEKLPMLAFLIGVTLSQMACQKFSAKKHSLVSQAVAFFTKYRELRGPAGIQEYHYNMGRVYHQLGLLPPALHHYKLALEQKPAFAESNKQFDLCREAAYNVHLIYLQSGAYDMARMYLEKYIII